MPTANVSIGLSSSSILEGTVSPASLTFTNFNYNTPQFITVTGVDDLADDGNVGYSIITAAAGSTDINYSGRDATDITVTNLNNDSVGIYINPTSGLLVSETGTTGTFSVVLAALPAGNVIINLVSSDIFEGTVSPPSLTFTPANWSLPQSATITGVNDFASDGNKAFTIVTTVDPTSDAAYFPLNPSDVSVTNLDNETLGITVTSGTGMTVSESGTSVSFSVVLNSQPSASVTIPVAIPDTTEGTVSSPFAGASGNLVFTTGNWNVPQTLIVAGVNDDISDGPIAFNVNLGPAAGGDYAGITIPSVSIITTDNDSAGVTVDTASSTLITTESLGTTSFSVVLNTSPTASVTIPVSVSNSVEGTITAPFAGTSGSLVFTAGMETYDQQFRI
jgi:hypothetical protein